jgi:hypothetical protein
MCPFCMLTAITVLSGPISAGGVGAVLVRKMRARPASGSVSDELEPRPQETSGYPSTTVPEEHESTDSPESQFALHLAETLSTGDSK